MNMLYLKNDLEWDLNHYASIISLENGRITEAIKNFTLCLEQKKAKLNESPKGEVVEIVEVPAEILEGFAKAMGDLQNQTTYNALFVMMVSYLEYSMTELSRLAGLYIGNNYHEYKKENGLAKAKNFLIEFLGIDISKYKEWSKFQINMSIRNVIAHNNSNIVVNYGLSLEEQPNYKLFTQNKKIIDVSETGFLYINDISYIYEIQEIQNKFISGVFRDVKQKLNEIEQ